jgi:STE24 endopeptidase
MGAHGYRLPLAMVVSVAAAGAATLAVRPRSGLIKPAPVNVTAYFSREEIDRARGYQRPQRLLWLAGVALEGGALALVATRPPRRVRRLLERAGRQPILGAAAVGAGLSAGLGSLTLPLSAVAHRRAVEAGLSVQTWRAWFGDVGKSGAIGAAMAAGGGALAIDGVRRFPGSWWIPGAAGMVALSSAFVLLSPVLLAPVFNKFTPLPEGDLRAEVLDLASRSGVKVGEVYRVDASRRTTVANAYVTGLGRTKRVVLYDTLLSDFPPDEVRSVVAHELSHVKHRDVIRSLLWLAISAPAAMFLVQQLTERIAGRDSLQLPAMLPALALAGGIVSMGGGVAGAALSRRVEARADAFALDLTEDPAAFIALEQRLAVKAMSDPQPPAVLQTLFGTHPDAVQRIGIGLEWSRQH